MPTHSEHEHLLAMPVWAPTPASSRPPSIASVLTTDTARLANNGKYSTPHIKSSPGTRPSYRGFRSEKEYLEALREWVEEKDFIHFDTSLTGFYGQKTMEYYKAKPGLRSKKGPESGKDADVRRRSVPFRPNLAKEQQGVKAFRQTESQEQPQPDSLLSSRAKRLGGLFRRQGTVT